MSILMKFELTVKAQYKQEIRQFFANILPGTRDFEGCEGACLASNEQDGSQLLLIEYWRSEEDFDKYLHWRSDIGDFDRLTGMLLCEPDIKPFDILD